MRPRSILSKHENELIELFVVVYENLVSKTHITTSLKVTLVIHLIKSNGIITNFTFLKSLVLMTNGI